MHILQSRFNLLNSVSNIFSLKTLISITCVW